MHANARKLSLKVRPEDVPEIKRRLAAGEIQSRIAADFEVNQGRISEIKTGKKYPEISAE